MHAVIDASASPQRVYPTEAESPHTNHEFITTILMKYRHRRLPWLVADCIHDNNTDGFRVVSNTGIDASRGSSQIAPVRRTDVEAGTRPDLAMGCEERRGGECPGALVLAQQAVFLPVSYLVPEVHLRRMARLVDGFLQRRPQPLMS